MDNEQKPWDQMENEPGRWFQRFEQFRLMGPGRSLLDCYVSEKARKSPKKPNGIPGAWKEAAEQWQWRKRAEAWDKYLSDLAAAEIEAKWKEQIMGQSEVLARLSQQARGDMGDFLDISPLGFVVDLNKAQEKGLTHLIHKVKQRTTINRTSNQNGNETETETHDMEIELYDAQAANVHMGRHYALFTDKQDITQRSYNVTIDGEEIADE